MIKYIIATATTIDGDDKINISEKAYDDINAACAELKRCYNEDLDSVKEWDSEPDSNIDNCNEWYYIDTCDGKIFAEVKSINI